MLYLLCVLTFEDDWNSFIPTKSQMIIRPLFEIKGAETSLSHDEAVPLYPISTAIYSDYFYKYLHNWLTYT